MTSEGSQHPGYEPDEAAPDAGGPRYDEADPRRRTAEEPWAPAGYDPPQRTDQWTPPGAAQTPWGTAAPGRQGDVFGGPRRDGAEAHGPINGHRPGAHDEPPPAHYTPAPAPIPQAPEPTPLPPQQTRVPGASFGAFPPAEPPADSGDRYGAIDYHGRTEYPASVPQPRSSSDGGASGRVSIPQPTDQPSAGGPSSEGPSYGGGPTGYSGPSGWTPPSGGGSSDDSGGFAGFAPAGSGFGGAQAAPPQGTTPTSGAPHSGSAQVGSARVAGSMGAASVPMGAVRIDPGQFGAAAQPGATPNRFGEADDERGGHASIPSQGGPTSGPPSGSASAGRAVSASASVPTASRVQPATDQPLPPPAAAPPQPRVYGRAVGAPAEPSAQPENSGFGSPSGFAPGGDQAAGEGFGVGRGSSGFQGSPAPDSGSFPGFGEAPGSGAPQGGRGDEGFGGPPRGFPGSPARSDEGGFGGPQGSPSRGDEGGFGGPQGFAGSQSRGDEGGFGGPPRGFPGSPARSDDGGFGGQQPGFAGGAPEGGFGGAQGFPGSPARGDQGGFGGPPPGFPGGPGRGDEGGFGGPPPGSPSAPGRDQGGFGQQPGFPGGPGRDPDEGGFGGQQGGFGRPDGGRGEGFGQPDQHGAPIAFGPPIEVPPAPPGPPGSYRSSARVSPPDVGNRPGSDIPEGPQGIRPPGGYAGSVSVPQGPGGPGAGPQGRISGPLNSGRPLGPINRAGSPGGPPTATWSAAPAANQGPFDAFRPDAEPATTAPASDDKPDPPAKERNGRVLAMVLGAAILLLVIPLAVVYLFTRSSGDGFNPAVGDCVRQSGNTAIAATCTEPDAFEVVSRVDDAANCPDKGQPVVEVSGGRSDNVLCLSPKAAAPPAGAGESPSAGPTN